MKNTVHYSFLLLTLLLSLNITAQEISGNDAQENLFKIGGPDATRGVIRKFDNRYEGAKGTPFYFASWSKGNILLVNGQRIENLELKYNAYEDELLMDKPEVGVVYLQKKGIKSFSLIETKTSIEVIFVKHLHPKKETEFKFYRSIFDGSIGLLEILKVVFEEADFKGGYSNDKRFDEFKKYPTYYYYSNSNSHPKKLKTSPSGVSKIFPNHNTEIKVYIAERNLDCKNESDLKKVFEYYQQMQ
jgi:hypothetical protein